eukprot:TRINITY_DN5216_c0_g2_i1.p2 TRINITY_DN5216_c0_g2~~TRINITY_DN5216_c0_g2_i1.p2  ORF type:complete len:108 (+),score=2.09 TRINITY_DN5216_c0_g2_i1:47-325(+)
MSANPQGCTNSRQCQALPAAMQSETPERNNPGARLCTYKCKESIAAVQATQKSTHTQCISDKHQVLSRNRLATQTPFEQRVLVEKGPMKKRR